MPSPTALRTFEAAARKGSFKAAAQELSVTPTAVSHQIRALEERLEIPLFVRRVRAVELTASGRQLFAVVHRAFQQILLALEEVSAAESVLTVSTTPAFAALWLVPRLGRFQDRHPELRIQLDTGTTPIDLERDRRIDVAIRYGSGPYPELHATRLFEETFGAYGTPDYLRGLKRWSDAVLIETVWRKPRLTPVSWEAWLAEAGWAGSKAPPSRRFDHEHYVVQAALASQGLVLASSVLVADLLDRGWLEQHEPEVNLVGQRYTALCLERSASLRKVRHFLKWLEEEASAMKTGQDL